MPYTAMRKEVTTFISTQDSTFRIEFHWCKINCSLSTRPISGTKHCPEDKTNDD